MNIGLLKHNVAIQTYTEGELSAYKTNKTWTSIAIVKGKLETVNGLITMDTMQINQKITHKVYIRYYPNLTTEHWLLINLRRFRIRSIINKWELNKLLELFCEEVFPESKTFFN